MLDQYRKEYSAEEKDLLPDSDSFIGKRKLLLIIAGATSALLFFLFLMGLFRTDDENLVQTDAKQNSAQESIVLLEQKLQTVTSRLEKLEQELAKSQTLQAVTSGVVAKHVSQTSLPQAQKEQELKDVQESKDLPLVVLSEPEDAVAMTSQAMRRMIEKEATRFNLALSTPKAPSKKEAPQKIAAKPKAKKTKEKIAANVPNAYVIQRGDTLSKISVRCYGTPNRWKAIYEANRDRINNINQLKVGTTLVIPQDKK
jgi:nucleoid-associated protein YgaU